MKVLFPKNIEIDYNWGVIKFRAPNGKLKFIDISKPHLNQIHIDGQDYIFTYLNSTGKNKGGNSIILKLFEVGSSDYDNPSLIMKILKYPIQRYSQKIHKRFRLERIALYKAKKEMKENIIEIYHWGNCVINNSEYLFYTMEPADMDLKHFIEENEDLSLESKVDLCMGLSNALKDLYSLNLYHRDIKPDNIFLVGEEWKIADLGLIAHRNDYFMIDKPNDFIGPRGWVSPEAMNKFICEDKITKYQYDCSIDHQSDIFQLGKSVYICASIQ